MKFKYVCKSKVCVNVNEVIVKDKCPCKAFSAEYCEECEGRLDKFSNARDIKREAVLKRQRENK